MDDILRFYLRRWPTLFGAGDDYAKAEYVVLGVPFDSTVSFVPGSRFGPLAVRLFSESIGHPGIARIQSKVADMGDIIPSVNVGTTLRRVFRVVRKICSDGKMPVMIGGEHTVTLASFKAVSKRSDVALLIFDAHLDLLDEFLDSRINHATWLRRLLENRRCRAAVVGFRDFLEEELRHGEDVLDLMIHAEEVHRSLDDSIDSIREFTKKSGSVYVSIDVDVLDISVCQGVSNPSPMGLTMREVMRLLESLHWENAVGIDVTEVNPLADLGPSAVNASYIIAHILSTRSATSSSRA